MNRRSNVQAPLREQSPPSGGVAAVDANRPIKKLIWLYFFLLIFEGALRKWFLPALATPLLIVRDPVALFAIWQAMNRGLLPMNGYIAWMVGCTVIGIGTALAFGHGNLIVALYGARIYLIHFPMMFVIGAVFRRKDVLKMGKAMLLISLPMIVLLVMQFYSPQSAWVNLGVGGDTEGAGFDGAMGFYRPPGTFSFTNGTALFFGLLACFVLYFWLAKGVPKWLLILATVSLLFSIPVSISRGLFFQVALCIMFALFAVGRKPDNLGKFVMAGVAGTLVIVVLGRLPMFSTAVEAFQSRFDAAGEREGGLEGTLLDRFIGDLVDSLFSTDDLPIFGYGLGMGTNVGSKLLTGTTVFLIAEGEWGRINGEMGPILGLIMIGIRLVFCLEILSRSYQRLKDGDTLPWILLGFALITVGKAQWAQPTGLGFSTLIGGLVLASLGRKPKRSPSWA